MKRNFLKMFVTVIHVLTFGAFSFVGCSKQIAFENGITDDKFADTWEYVFFEKPEPSTELKKSRFWLSGEFRSYYECFLKFKMQPSEFEVFSRERGLKEITVTDLEDDVRRIQSEPPDWFPVKGLTLYKAWAINIFGPIDSREFPSWKKENMAGYVFFDPKTYYYYIYIVKDDRIK